MYEFKKTCKNTARMGIRNGLEEAIFIINLKITSKKKERTLQNEVLQRPLCLHSEHPKGCYIVAVVQVALKYNCLP